MKNYRIFYFIYCLILFLSLDLTGQGLQHSIELIVEDQIAEAEFSPGFNIIVTKQGETIYQRSIGFANIDSKIEMKPEQVLRIGSITKQFTAIAILQLEEQGKLSLNDNITKYVEDFPSYGSDVTIHHLLAHTSGIPNHSDLNDFDRLFANKSSISPLDIITAFKDKDPKFLAGEKASYNNFGYIILGYIIEQVAGMSYREYLAQEIFAPLKMKSTSYLNENYKSEELTIGYKKSKNAYVTADNINLQLPFSAGGLCSTIGDIARWYDHVYQAQSAGEKIYETALTRQATNDGLATGYGYGWQTGSFRGRTYFGHDGVISGFNSDTRYFLEDQLFIGVLSNCEGDGASRLLRKISDAILSEHKSIIDSESVNQEYIDKLSGKYELRPGFVIEISNEDDKVYGIPNGQSKVELKPIKGAKFYVQEIEAEIEFKTDDDGAINSFTLVQGGQENHAQRINN